MIEVSVEVRSGAGRFRAVVWAQSIERAVSLMSTRYPGCQAKVLFPIEPEAFFTNKGPVPASGMVLPEVPEEAAG